MPFDEQILRIKDKLKTAKTTDDNLHVFGAEFHKYQLNSPLSQGKVKKFEKKHNVELPQPYREFITRIGNGGKGKQGGAGPYYGLHELGKPGHLEHTIKTLNQPCRLHPNISDGEWNKLVEFKNLDALNDKEYHKLYHGLFHGMMCIGTQGSSYHTMLVVSGFNKGRVIYMNENLKKPFFTYENSFLDWYERWLDEIINGYDITSFGMKMGGDELELIKKLQTTDDIRYQAAAIEGFLKLPSVKPETIDYLSEQCKHTEIKIRDASLYVLTKNAYDQAKPILKWLFHSDTEEDVLVAVQSIYLHAREKSPEWVGDIKQVLRHIDNIDAFKFAICILEESQTDYGELLIPFFKHKSNEIRIIAIDSIGKLENKSQYIKDFKKCLIDPDVKIKHVALQALSGIVETDLLPFYDEILDEYETNDEYILSNVIDRLIEMKKDARPVLEKAAVHSDGNIAKEARKLLKKLGPE